MPCIRETLRFDYQASQRNIYRVSNIYPLTRRFASEHYISKNLSEYRSLSGSSS